MTRLRVWARALRLHQWLKNILVFAPLVAAHRVHEPLLLGQATLAFLAMSLCASAVYLINDYRDIEEDRSHPLKRARPLAAGEMTGRAALTAAPLLLFCAVGTALLLPPAFLFSLLAYVLLAMAYNFLFRRIVLLDVLALALLYILRITAGAAAVSVAPSLWLLAFSLFLFLNLATLKRYTELRALQARGEGIAGARGYRAADLPLLVRLGAAGGGAAVLVLAFYIGSDMAQALYGHPRLLWLLCPLLVCLLARMWLLARKGELHEDPVVFVVTDRPGQWLAAAGAALLWVAS